MGHFTKRKLLFCNVKAFRNFAWEVADFKKHVILFFGNEEYALVT